jgi:esterase
MLLDHARQPAPEALRGLAVGGQADTAAERASRQWLREEHHVQERDGEESILELRRRPAGHRGTLHADRMNRLREIPVQARAVGLPSRERHPGRESGVAALAVRLVDQIDEGADVEGAPTPSASGACDALFQASAGVMHEGLDETSPTPEVVVNRGIREAEVARDRLHPDRIGASFDEALLRGFEYRAASLVDTSPPSRPYGNGAPLAKGLTHARRLAYLEKSKQGRGPAMSSAEEIAHHELAARIAGLEIPEFTAPDEHQVVLGQMRFHYLDWGVRGAPPIVFLHGGGQTARTWDLVCLAMRGDYRCLALDQRGHGDSEWSYVMDYGPEAQARDVAAFVDHLGFERFVLVGMSMGCINALHYALQHPDRLAALVAVDAGPAVRTEGGERIVDFRRRTAELDSVEEYLEQAMRFNPRRDPRLLRRSLLHNLRRLPNGKWTWKTDPRPWLDVDDLMRRMAALWTELWRIRCPTLVVRGEESDVFLDEHAERFAQALPNGRWERVERAGHTIQGDNPRGLVDTLRRFLVDPAIGWSA